MLIVFLCLAAWLILNLVLLGGVFVANRHGQRTVPNLPVRDPFHAGR